MAFTPEQRKERAEAKAKNWEKCRACGGRGEWRQRGAFAQTVGCEDCGSIGHVEPLPRMTRAHLERITKRSYRI